MNGLPLPSLLAGATAVANAAVRDDKVAGQAFAGVLDTIGAPPDPSTRRQPTDAPADAADAEGPDAEDEAPAGGQATSPAAVDLSALAQAAAITTVPQAPVPPPTATPPSDGEAPAPARSSGAPPAGVPGSRALPPTNAASATTLQPPIDGGAPAKADDRSGDPSTPAEPTGSETTPKLSTQATPRAPNGATPAPGAGAPWLAGPASKPAAVPSRPATAAPEPAASIAGPATPAISANAAPKPAVSNAQPATPANPATGGVTPQSIGGRAQTQAEATAEQPEVIGTALPEGNPKAAANAAGRDAGSSRQPDGPSAAPAPSPGSSTPGAIAEQARASGTSDQSRTNQSGSAASAGPQAEVRAPQTNGPSAEQPAASQGDAGALSGAGSGTRTTSAKPGRRDGSPSAAAPAVSGASAAETAVAPASPGQQVANALQSLVRDNHAPAAAGPSASAASAPASVLPSVTQTSASAAQGVKTLTVELDPGHLGPVSVTMRLVGDAISIHIGVSNPETLRILERDKHLLSSAVEALGGSADALRIGGAGSVSGGATDGSGQGPPQNGAARQDVFSSDASSGGRHTPNQNRQAFRAEPETSYDEPTSPPVVPSRGRDGSLYL